MCLSKSLQIAFLASSVGCFGSNGGIFYRLESITHYFRYEAILIIIIKWTHFHDKVKSNICCMAVEAIWRTPCTHRQQLIRGPLLAPLPPRWAETDVGWKQFGRREGRHLHLLLRQFLFFWTIHIGCPQKFWVFRHPPPCLHFTTPISAERLQNQAIPQSIPRPISGTFL